MTGPRSPHAPDDAPKDERGDTTGEDGGQQERLRNERDEPAEPQTELDEALEGTFPASDPAVQP